MELSAAPPGPSHADLSDYEDEAAMLQTMFSDELQRLPRDPSIFLVSLELGFTFEIAVPKRGYPMNRRPTLTAVGGPNALLCAQAERRACEAVAERVVPLDAGGEGFPVLAAMVMACQQVVSDISAELEEAKAAAAAANSSGEGTEGLLDAAARSGIHVMQGEPITDRKSTFLAHVARVRSNEEVQLVVQSLRANRHIACAAHPAIVAYRFRASNGVLHQDSDDDGETGASKKLLFLLEQLKLDDVLLVVTRWFGGILLGPDRFKHIMGCAKQALVQHKFITS
jgi:hypothetical protein